MNRFTGKTIALIVVMIALGVSAWFLFGNTVGGIEYANADRYTAGDATVTAESAAVFADSGILLLGNEGQSVGPEEAPMEVHLTLLRRGIALLEGIVLTDIPEGRYFLSAAPLNLAGCDGAPCRAYLIGEVNMS